jgi:signal transduction histidine kinase
LRPKYICLDHILAEVKERHTKVPGRDIIMTYTALCDCCVFANELLIDVFTNIVGNAIKHSTGPLAIDISLQVIEEEERLYCKVTVEDTGPGIPDEQKSTIFRRAGKEQAKLTGKGLGLYLVKTLVDDFRGKVWVEDRVPGDYTKGTRFVVLLPAVAGRGEVKAEGTDVYGG